MPTSRTVPIATHLTPITLKASELRYRRLFEAAKDGILILDATTGKVTDSNPYLEGMLGYSHDELIGKTLWEIGPLKDVAASKAAFRRLQTHEYIRYENLPLQSKGRGKRQVEFVSNVYTVADRRVIQCNIRDITSRRTAEEALELAHDNLLALVGELQRHDRDMEMLNGMQDLLLACATQQEAHDVVALLAGKLFAGTSGCLLTLQASKSDLETAATWGDDSLVSSIFSFENCWAMRRGRVHEAADRSTSMPCNHFVRPPPFGSFCVPLTVRGEVLGLLCLVWKSVDDPTRRAGQHLLAVTAGEAIKLCLSNLALRESLRDQAIMDPLTGLFNRRYLEGSLLRELHRARRGDSPLCVVMLDLDHFKQFNDRFGHETGDAILRAFGQILQQHLRKSDIACRFGGEEFVLVLPESSLADTLARVEALRLLVKVMEVHHGEQMLGRLSFSAGIAEAGVHGGTAEELLRAADEAMYAAKKAGRDRVVACPTPE